MTASRPREAASNAMPGRDERRTATVQAARMADGPAVPPEEAGVRPTIRHDTPADGCVGANPLWNFG
ncbi:MAG: hypothetical protein FJX35_24745 [Alphaproteobacteria bacterium]|nr:hypothetical protein [Alphaproteobacteria bacterium]